MYKISDTQYALESGDRISFVRDGGGTLRVEAGDDGAPAPLVNENGIDLVVIEVDKEQTAI